MAGREGQGRGASLGVQGEARLLGPMLHPSCCTYGTVAIKRGRETSLLYPSRASVMAIATNPTCSFLPGDPHGLLSPWAHLYRWGDRGPQRGFAQDHTSPQAFNPPVFIPSMSLARGTMGEVSRGWQRTPGCQGQVGKLKQPVTGYGPPSKACMPPPQVTACEVGKVAAEAELLLLQLSVHQGWGKGGLSMRPGGSERRSKLPEAAQQWRTALMDPELELVPSFWWSGRWPQPQPMCPDSSPQVRVQVCAICRPELADSV